MIANLKVVEPVFKVERGVPLPEPRNIWRCRYPLADMEPGDSFVVPAEHYYRVGKSMSNFAKKTGLKFTIRKLPDGGARIWRVI